MPCVSPQVRHDAGMARRPDVGRTSLSIVRTEAAKRLPFTTYLNIINTGILTGVLPVLDHQGNETGRVQELTSDQRIDLARFAINKFLPDAPKEIEEAATRALDSVNARLEEVRALSDAELRQVLDADFQIIAPASA